MKLKISNSDTGFFCVGQVVSVKVVGATSSDGFLVLLDVAVVKGNFLLNLVKGGNEV